MTSTFSIVAVQAPPLSFSLSLNRFAEDVSGVVSRNPGVHMVVYPELHLFHADPDPGGTPNVAAALDEVTMASDFVRSLTAIARDHRIWLIPGSLNERGVDGELYNTATVINPQGDIVASYRKMFPWRPFEPYTPGSTFVVFDIEDVGRVGLNTCYDMWFPETCRHLAWMGAELIINLVKTTTPDRAQEILLTRANAIANQVALLSVNSAGPTGFGCSLIVGPEGEILTEAMHTDRAELRFSFDRQHIEEIRKKGTAGVNRMWQQFRPGDQRIDLPLYNGFIDPSRWTPVHRTPNN